LFGAFKDLGGRGIEVLSGSQKDDEVSEFARIAREFGFLPRALRIFTDRAKAGSTSAACPICRRT
jgi:predicted metal-dependent phosphoesterase TrpH